MDWLMASLSRLGNGGLLWLLLAGGLLLYRPTRRQGLEVLLALALEVLLCNILLKPWLARPRPFWLRPDMELLLAPPADFSFPSGHTGPLLRRRPLCISAGANCDSPLYRG